MLAVLDTQERAWSFEELCAAPRNRPLSADRLGELLPDLEALGFLERRVGEGSRVYRLSPLGRRTLHHWIDTGQWRPTSRRGPGERVERPK